MTYIDPHWLLNIALTWVTTNQVTSDLKLRPSQLVTNVGLAPKGNKENLGLEQVKMTQNSQILLLIFQRKKRKIESSKLAVVHLRAARWLMIKSCCHWHQQQHWGTLTGQEWPDCWSNKKNISFLRIHSEDFAKQVFKCRHTLNNNNNKKKTAPHSFI